MVGQVSATLNQLLSELVKVVLGYDLKMTLILIEYE